MIKVQKFRNLKLKYKIVIPLLLAMLFLFIGIIIVTVYAHKRTYDYNTAKLIETKIREIETTTEQVANKALYIASISSEMEIVQQAYSQYYESGDLKKASSIIESQFKTINKLIYENTGYKPRIHFHLPPAISFCRCWSDVRGDDLSGFRNSVLKVSKEQAFVKGIETGRGGFVIRGIAPIFSEAGKYYGSVEAFFNINQLLKEISINTNEEFAVFMYTDLLKISTNFLEDRATNIKDEKQVIGEYILVEKTKKFQIENILKHKLNPGKINKGVFEYDNYKYAVIPIKNIVGEIEGLGVLQINISDYKESLRDVIIFEFILFLFLIITIMLVLSGLSNRYIIKKIKSTDLALQKLSRGELTNKIIVQNDDEIGNMQKSLNLLSENRNKNTQFALEIGSGNLQTPYHEMSKNNLLGNALIEMQQKLIKSSEETKNAFEKSIQSEEKYRLLIEQSNDAIYLLVDNKFEIINQQFTKMFGYTLKETNMPNFNFIKMVAPKSHHIISKRIEKFKKGEELNPIYEFTALTKEGEEIECETSISRVKFKNQTATQGVIRNITEKKKLWNELLIAKEKADESNRLKTEFLNNISHEIRTPMNGILGFSNQLKKPNLSLEKQKNYTDIISRSTNQLLQIVDDIIEISSLETKQISISEKEVCINDMLLKLFSIFDIKAKEKKIPLYLKKVLSDRSSKVITDINILSKAMGNLIENAIKFTHQGLIEFGYSLHENNIQFYVKDTGIGIEANKYKLIFERFSQEDEQTAPNYGGLGLGLSIAKENTELLGGEITLESEKGKGSTFYISIPYKPVYTDIENGKPTKGTTVLIVEDEELNHLFLETLLEDISDEIDTVHAKNGKEAIKICKNNSKISLILMDLKMPVLNGFEATKLIREFLPNIPIIAQTAYTSKADKEKAINAGCDEFISKPIDEESMNAIIHRYINVNG